MDEGVTDGAGSTEGRGPGPVRPRGFGSGRPQKLSLSSIGGSKMVALPAAWLYISTAYKL